MRLLFAICFMSAVLTGAQGCRPSMVAQQTAEGVELRQAGKKVLFYQSRPLKVNGQYERAGYIHPLYDLEGEMMTEDGPADHPYHRGIYWAWHQIIHRGIWVADGWMPERVAFIPVSVKAGAGRRSGFVEAEMIWRTAARDLLREHTVIRAYPSEKNYRIVDVDILLVPLTDSLALGGANDAKGYGGFCLRLQLPPDISFHSQGKQVNAQEAAVAAGPWMDFSGSYEGRRRGVTVFCRPGGLQGWILRERRSMQNVVFPGRHPELLPPEGWRLQYRLVVHNGQVSQTELEILYRRYVAE